MMIGSSSWQDIAQAKQNERASRIPKEWIIPEDLYKSRTNVIDVPETCGLLTAEELDITSNHDATALLEKLAGGTLSSEAVTVAFCKRAAIAQQLVRSLIPAELNRCY
jgi:amidase